MTADTASADGTEMVELASKASASRSAIGVYASAASQLASLANGEVTSLDLLEAHLDQLDRHAALNAVITIDKDGARRAAKAADAVRQRGEPCGPLHGLPMTVKDTYDTAGMRTTVGVPWLAKNVPTRDAALVARVRAAGAILDGKTNIPFASYDWQANHPTFGRCTNPRDAGRRHRSFLGLRESGLSATSQASATLSTGSVETR